MNNFIEYLRKYEDQISIWLGGIAVFLVAVLFFWYFKSVNPSGQITESASRTEYEQTEEVLSLQTGQNLPVSYRIQKGDSLWKIAETVYSDGYLWTDIYEANKSAIDNPDKLLVGTEITIPKIEGLGELVIYSVEQGDSLWTIAENQCGSGYEWSDIARQNSLVNPGVIHVGNVLKFRCGVR